MTAPKPIDLDPRLERVRRLVFCPYLKKNSCLPTNLLAMFLKDKIMDFIMDPLLLAIGYRYLDI